MRVALALAVLWLAASASPLAAEAPSTSQRPMPRPAVTGAAPVVQAQPAQAPAVQASVASAAGGVGRSLRPLPRPALAGAPALAVAAPVLVAVIVAPATAGTPRPMPRPLATARLAAPAPDAPAGSIAASALSPRTERRGGLLGMFGTNRQTAPRERAPSEPASGYVCGDRAIKGTELAPITSSTRGCGVAEPVRVTHVAGVRLSTPATIDCATASALKTWVQKGLQPAFRKEIVEVKIAASYICRTRNNQRGARISEHGRGKAVDVSGLVFSDGREISVARDYGREFRRAHRAACGIFGTTLGPGSDGYHEDHLHFDTASHRNGPYCR